MEGAARAAVRITFRTALSVLELRGSDVKITTECARMLAEYPARFSPLEINQNPTVLSLAARGGVFLQSNAGIIVGRQAVAWSWCNVLNRAF